MKDTPQKPKVNPLAGMMRQPKIFIRLPSKGKYWPEGSIISTTTGEYPVYSMTAKDELMLKTPDALLNGQAIVSVIESCVPNITNAWDTPNLDVDTLLIAIRLATYGENMETTVTVSGVEGSYLIDLRNLLDQLYNTIVWDERIEIDDNMVIYIRPLTYKDMSDSNIETFETQRIMNLVNDDKLSEDKKLELFKDSFQKLTKVTLDIVINSIYKIDSVTGSVVDLEFIKEFMDKCDRKIFNMVRKKLEELKEKNTVKPMRMKATEEMIAAGSAEEIEVPIVFDPSTFFV